jgi:hypothetical protein
VIWSIPGKSLKMVTMSERSLMALAGVLSRQLWPCVPIPAWEDR